MTDNNHIAALEDLRAGVQMDRHNLPDSDAKLAALDTAIAVLSKLREAGEPSDEELEALARRHGTGGWQTLPDMVRFARTLLARYAAPQASAEEIRNAALEEAAALVQREACECDSCKAVDDLWTFPPKIRALKSTAAKDGGEPGALSNPNCPESRANTGDDPGALRPENDGKTRDARDYVRGPMSWDSAKGAGDEREPSPTKGMNIAQRILHVGGRNNQAGYVEFGSTQAVEALVRQVLRDLDWAGQDDDGAFQARYRIPGGEWSSWGHVSCGVKGHEQQLRYLPADRQQRGGDVNERAAWEKVLLFATQIRRKLDSAEVSQSSASGIGHDACERAIWIQDIARAALAAQPAASAEPVLRDHLQRPVMVPSLAAQKVGDGDAKDAERYRWLRVRWGRIEDTYDGDTDQIVEIREADDKFEGWEVSPESLDAAIDAAMQQQSQEGK